MKMEDRDRTRVRATPCERPVALMLTHNRVGSLLGTVGSYWRSCEVPLHVFDDGSSDLNKPGELALVEGTGANIHKMEHRGFARSWREALVFARENLTEYDCVVMLEDDLRFAKGWMGTLQAMQRGISALGMGQGMTTCFRPHESPQSGLVDLKGIEAYQSFGHTWHANMLPMDALERWDIFERSVGEVEAKRQHGLDVHYVGNLAHMAGRLSFVSTRSWVAHVECDSVVKGQGFRNCAHPGVNLVGELKGFESIWKTETGKEMA